MEGGEGLMWVGDEGLRMEDGGGRKGRREEGMKEGRWKEGRKGSAGECGLCVRAGWGWEGGKIGGGGGRRVDLGWARVWVQSFFALGGSRYRGTFS